MSIHVNPYQENFDLISLHVYGRDSISSFKELVQRATNLWPDAPAEIKEFADLITNGRVLQDYKSQDTSVKTI